MREIKFRAWDKKRKEYTYIVGFTIYNEGNITIFYREKNGEVSSYTTITNDIVLEQYTGLKDKNGKEIYEGDIVRHNDFIEDKFDFDRYNQTKIEFSVHGYNLPGTIQLGSDVDYDKNDYEVIGNIYENPELLN